MRGAAVDELGVHGPVPEEAPPTTRRRVLARGRRAWQRTPITLLAVAAVAIASHATLIWHHAVPDFDTDSFITRAEAGCDPHWIRKGMGDSAHPLGNALIPRGECLFHGSHLLTPAQAWYLALTLAVVAIVLLLGAASHAVGAEEVRAALAVAYLGMAPAMRTMSTRADEKWIGAALFLVVVLCMLRFHRTPGVSLPGAALVAVASTVLGLWHTQYLVILGVALGLWGAVALIRPRLVATTRVKAIVLGVAVLIPPLAAVGALTWTGYVTKVAYHEEFFSIFNKHSWHGPVPWLHDFVTYSARWIPGWLDDNGAQEVLFPAPKGEGFVVLGVVGLVLFIGVAVATRNGLLCAIAVGSLALPFMYEPDNAERWDGLSMVFALCLAVGAMAADRRERPGVDATSSRESPEGVR